MLTIIGIIFTFIAGEYYYGKSLEALSGVKPDGTIYPTITQTTTHIPTYKPTTIPTPISTFGNSVSNLRITNYPNYITATVDYTFLSEHGDIAKIAGLPISNGKFQGNFSYTSEIITKGRGTAEFCIKFYPSEKEPTKSTDQIVFIMWNEKYGNFFSVPHNFNKTWNSN